MKKMEKNVIQEENKKIKLLEDNVIKYEEKRQRDDYVEDERRKRRIEQNQLSLGFTLKD